MVVQAGIIICGMGGTNFGRNSMYLQTTSYEFDAPLDEYGAISAKGAYLARLHHLLAEHANLLLEGDIQRKIVGEATHVEWKLPAEELTIKLSPGNGGQLSYNGQLLFDIPLDFQQEESSFPLTSLAHLASDI